MSIENNPLLKEFTGPFGSAPFAQIKHEHYLPALDVAIKEGKENIEKIKKSGGPTFANTIEAMEYSSEKLDAIAGIFYNLHSANTDEKMQALAKEMSPKMTEFSNDIGLDAELFARIKTLHDKKDSLGLNPEQLMLLEKRYKSFVRNGALLNDEQKQKLRDIDKRASEISLKFGDNVLAERSKFELVLDKKEEVEGIPDWLLEAALQTGKEKGKEGKWVFTLDYPSFGPFITYAKNRSLREKIFKASSTIGAGNNEYDNREIVKEIAKLRHERANLLGFATHADFVLEERMAEKPKNVTDFLDKLYSYALPVAKEDVKLVEDFAKKLDGIEQLQKWDFGYYSEKLKKEKYDIDTEVLKPYFKLENVIDGVFTVAKKLYGLTFERLSNVETYHPEVMVYDVKDENGKHISLFYADYFPRASKRSGAWMTAFRSQRVKNGVDERPHVAIVCNFTKPTESRPSLLTFDEVLTLFHEFGHALHGMLSNCQYETLSGTSVYWDFVELPSQILENWAYEKECLDLFAKHYETGAPIPVELVKKIKDSSNFLEGRATLRQLSFAMLDMAWHSADPRAISSVEAFEVEKIEKTDILPATPGSLISTAFSHIFQGGYSAGYYSYKFAEVLDADAFEYFKEKGIFNPEVAKSFKDNVLSRGGSDHPMNLYKKFRGSEPKVEALLRRSGMMN